MPVHPIIQRVIKRAYSRGHGELPLQNVAQVRQYYARQPLLQQVGLQYEDHQIAPQVQIRVHHPLIENTFLSYPLIMYFRASAYALGQISDTDYFCHYLSQHLNCVVAAIEPRLSPEAKFPLPFNDCIAAVEYLYNHASLLKIDFKKAAIWGESSGGNYAASLSAHFNKVEKTLFSHQILFYPMLDYYNSYPSKITYGNGYLMDNALTDWIMNNYVVSPADYQDSRVSPVLAPDFAHLPHTVIIGAQYDPMRDELYAYQQALAKAKVPVDALYFPGMIHGFLWYTEKLEAAQTAQYYAASILKQGWE